MATKPTTSDRLDLVRVDLQNVARQIDDIETQRAAALLGDDDAKAVELDLQLVKLRAQSRVLTDKAKLLSGQIEDERRAAAAQLREERVDEFRRKLEQADKVAARVQGIVLTLERAYRELIRLRGEARQAWPAGGNSHVNAVADTVEGCALSPGAIRALLSYEQFRISHHPLLGGKPGERVEVSLPGSACPDLRLQGLPEKVMPFAERLRRASAYAVEVMKGVENPAPPEITVPPEIVASPEISSPLVTSPPATLPTPPPDHGVNLRNVTVPTGTSRSGTTWSQLTAEQMRLANGPQNEQTEQAYQAVIAELAEMTKEQAA